MQNTSAPNLLVMLAGEDKVGRVVVQLESFLDFSHEVSIALDNLETDWLHAASPRARRLAMIDDRAFDFPADGSPAWGPRE